VGVGELPDVAAGGDWEDGEESDEDVEDDEDEEEEEMGPPTSLIAA
jgi:hypothetical protein